VPKNPNNPNEIVYLATKEGQIPVYDELVVFQSSLIIPRYVVSFSKILEERDSI
jgi:hypothetical protein